MEMSQPNLGLTKVVVNTAPLGAYRFRLTSIPENTPLDDSEAKARADDQDCTRDVTPMYQPGVRDHCDIDDRVIARLARRRTRRQD
mmetsp:Transcript_110723/g.278370  ORF Transcript_110723/g.278370 Transcript_110723/m.278370 type:complete len:86 (+) Transcript_110723:49-306(+)